MSEESEMQEEIEDCKETLLDSCKGFVEAESKLREFQKGGLR